MAPSPKLIVTVAVVASAAALAAPPVASAAVFSDAPPAFVKPSDAPFSYAFDSSQDHAGPYGWVAYRLPGEDAWHRCQAKTIAEVASLPDGVYAAEISDDINVEEWNSRGLGATAIEHCKAPEPPPGFARTRRSLVVDAVAPVIHSATVQSAGLDVLLATEASDSAVDSAVAINWRFGDGFSAAGAAVRYRYFAYGAYTVTVTVADSAGNTSERTLPVVLSPPLPPATAPTAGDRPTRGSCAGTRRCRCNRSAAARAAAGAADETTDPRHSPA